MSEVSSVALIHSRRIWCQVVAARNKQTAVVDQLRWWWNVASTPQCAVKASHIHAAAWSRHCVVHWNKVEMLVGQRSGRWMLTLHRFAAPLSITHCSAGTLTCHLAIFLLAGSCCCCESRKSWQYAPFQMPFLMLNRVKALKAKRRYLSYSEGDFEVFLPRRGDTQHWLEWNLARRSTPSCQISTPSVQW